MASTDLYCTVRDINYVIMNYLVSEGFPNSARSFSKEANIVHEPEDDELIQTRVDIKNAIHAGNIQDAIEMINELNPEVSSSSPIIPQLLP